jgi:hypothetical protein
VLARRAFPFTDSVATAASLAAPLHIVESISRLSRSAGRYFHQFR